MVYILISCLNAVGCSITTTVLLLPQTFEQVTPDATHAETAWSKLIIKTNIIIIIHVPVRPNPRRVDKLGAL